MRIISLLLFLSVLFGCASRRALQHNPKLTTLELKNLQIKTFDASDSKTLMKAIINVLQDEGYVIKTTNLELGVITAEKDIDIENKWKSFFSSLVSGYHATWNKHAVLEISSNLIEQGKFQKVRANFQVKIFDNFGRVVKIHPVTDAQHYNQFFVKIAAALIMPAE